MKYVIRFLALVWLLVIGVYLLLASIDGSRQGVFRDVRDGECLNVFWVEEESMLNVTRIETCDRSKILYDRDAV